MIYRYAVTFGYFDPAVGKEALYTLNVHIPEPITTPNGVALAFAFGSRHLDVHPAKMAIVNVITFAEDPSAPTDLPPLTGDQPLALVTLLRHVYLRSTEISELELALLRELPDWLLNGAFGKQRDLIVGR